MKIKTSGKAGFITTGVVAIILVFSIGVKSPSEPARDGNLVLRLDGDRDYVDIPNSPSLNPTKAITCECWVKIKSLVDVDYDVNMFLNKEHQYEMGVMPRVQGDNVPEWHLAFHIAAMGSWKWFDGGGPLEKDIWYHCAVVYDARLSQVRTYLNGQLQRIYHADGLIARRIARIKLGSRTLGGRSFLKGELDEVRIWNIARTQEQIRETIKKSLIGKEKGLVGYWNFDNGNAKDASPYRNHGKLKGDATTVPIGSSDWRSLPLKQISKTVQKVKLHNRVRVVPEQNTQVQRRSKEVKVRPTRGLTDIGGPKTADGKRIKRGLIYRASFHPYVLPDQKTISQFKLIIDYRLDDESPLQRNVFRESNGTKMIRLRFWAYPTRREADQHWHTERPAIFAKAIRKSPKEIRRTFSLLADENNYPVLYFCSYGIHRATMISSILYLALDGSEEAILDATNEPRLMSNNPGSLRCMLKTVFGEINKPGGITEYFKKIGVSEQEITAFQQIMLED